MLGYRQWLNGKKPTTPPSMFVAAGRDCRRDELKLIAKMKRVADEMHTRLAMDTMKHPPDKVARVRVVLKSLKGQIADFEA